MNQSDDRELPVHFHTAKAREQLERSKRSAGIIRVAMLVVAVALLVAGLLLDPINYPLIIFGIAEGVMALFYLPRILLRESRARAATRTASDDTVLVLTEHGVRRTTGDESAREFPYAEVTLRPSPTDSVPVALVVELPEEQLTLPVDLLHPSIDEILESYERLRPAEGAS